MMKVKMKLQLLFTVMDLFIVLAYPIVFVHGQLRKFAKSHGNLTLANLLDTGPAMPTR